MEYKLSSTLRSVIDSISSNRNIIIVENNNSKKINKESKKKIEDTSKTEEENRENYNKREDFKRESYKRESYKRESKIDNDSKLINAFNNKEEMNENEFSIANNMNDNTSKSLVKSKSASNLKSSLSSTSLLNGKKFNTSKSIIGLSIKDNNNYISSFKLMDLKPTANIVSNTTLYTNNHKSKKSTKLSEEFEDLVYEITDYLKYKSEWRIQSYYDAVNYIKDPSNPIPEPVAKTGTLPMIFMYYSKKSNPVGQSRSVVTFDNIRLAQYAISFGEILSFCQDFNLFPELIDKGDIYWAYGSVQQGRGDGSGLSDISFPDFLQVLTMFANKLYSRPEYKNKYPTSLSRVRALIDFLDLKSYNNIKSKLDSMSLIRFKRKIGLKVDDEEDPDNHRFLKKHSGNAHTEYYKKDLIEPECINELRQFDVNYLPEHWVSYRAAMIDMGNVSKVKRHEYKIVIQNCSNAICQIHVDTSLATFFRVEYSKHPISNGMSFTIRVILDVTDETGELLTVLPIRMDPTTSNPNLKLNYESVCVYYPIYCNVVSATDSTANFVPNRAIPGCERLWDVTSPRLRTSFHPDALTHTHLTNNTAAENRKNLSKESGEFRLPSKEEIFFKLNPPLDNKPMKKIDNIGDGSAMSFVDMANYRIRQNEMEKELRVQMSDVILDVPTDPESVKADKRARRTLTRLLVGNKFNTEQIKKKAPTQMSIPAVSAAILNRSASTIAKEDGLPKSPILGRKSSILSPIPLINKVSSDLGE